VVEEFDGDVKKELLGKYKTIKGKKKALLLDAGLKVMRDVSVGDIGYSLKKTRNKVFAVLMDGVATRNVIQECDEKGVSHLGAKNFSYVEGSKVNLISL
jgi:hypothetical protein